MTDLSQTHLFTVIDQALFPVVLIMVAGYFWKITSPGGVDAATARRVINTLVMNVFYPALAFHVISRVEIGSELLMVPALTIAGILVGMAMAKMLFSSTLLFSGIGRSEMGSLILACGFGNIVSLGIPVLQATYGEDAVRYAIYSDILGISPTMWTLGIWVALRYGTKGEHFVGGGQFFKMLLKLPPIWAFVLAFAVNMIGWVPPEGVMKATKMAGYATMPCMLLTVGMSLSFGSFKNYGAIIFGTGLIKLILAPALVWALGLFLFGNVEMVRAISLETAMPTMMAVIMLSEQFGLNTELLAVLLVATTGMFFLTLPFWLAFLS